MILVTNSGINIEVFETKSGGRMMYGYSPVTRKIIKQYTHPSRAKSFKRFVFDVNKLEKTLHGINSA